MDQLEKVLLLLNEPIDQRLVHFYLDMMGQYVKNYCHRKDLPLELELLVVQMTVEYMNLKFGPKQDADSDGVQAVGKAKAITRGDTRIEFATSGDLGDRDKDGRLLDLGIRGFVANYERQLNAFRKLVSR